MSDDPSQQAPPNADEEVGRPIGRAARAGHAAAALRRRLRTLSAAAAAGLRPVGRTVRQDIGDAFAHLRRNRYAGRAAVALVVGFYLLSGTYLVSPGEVAVVTRFGRVVEPRVGPGIRWRLPSPFESARIVNVGQVRREGIGTPVAGHTPELHPPEDIQLLTGDENLLTAKAVVQYRVRDPADYLFRVDYNEDPLLRSATKAALVELAGGLQVDTLLTSGRTEIQEKARTQVQRTLDAYRSGLEVVSIDLQEVAPPGDVAQAFRDVSSAAEEKNKAVNDAQGYANSVVPQARGEAQRRQREAEGYRTDVVNRARGEAQRFGDVLAQYQRDAQVFGSDVTRYRLYVETMEKILPRARKYILDPTGPGERPSIRILDQLPMSVGPTPGR